MSSELLHPKLAVALICSWCDSSHVITFYFLFWLCSQHAALGCQAASSYFCFNRIVDYNNLCNNFEFLTKRWTVIHVLLNLYFLSVLWLPYEIIPNSVNCNLNMKLTMFPLLFRYTDDMELDDAVHTAILTLKEG